MPQPTIPSSQDPRSLYSECKDRERALLSWDLSAFKNKLMTLLTFRISAGPMLKRNSVERPILGNAHTGSRRPASQRNLEKVNPPLDAYLTLVQTLKKIEDNNDLWFFLALWLKHEAIREPEEFLPSAIYKRLTRNVRKRAKISFTDMRYFELVRCWEPYFARLLEDCKRLRPSAPDLQKELCALGYEPKAVVLIEQKKWRSAVELACEWLAGRQIIPAKSKEPDPARTLRNAYSRIKAGVSTSKALQHPEAGLPARTNAKKAK
jgi:hypothetical protein